MSNKTQNQTQNQVDEEEHLARAKKDSETLAAGGMSPLADRKDPSDWAKSVPAAPASGGDVVGPKGARAATPPEPVGGWVNASTGRGKILVPEKEAVGRSHELDRHETTPTIVVKGKETKENVEAPKPEEAPSERVRTLKGPDAAAAKKPGSYTDETEASKEAAYVEAQDDAEAEDVEDDEAEENK